MKAWWLNLQQREQLIVLVAVVVVMLLLLDSLIVSPYQDARQSLDESIEQAELDLQWMESAVLRLSTSSERKTSFNGNLLTQVDSQIKRLKLKDNMKQMSPVNERTVKLRLEDADFNQLLRLIDSLDKVSIAVDEIRVLPAEKNGFVNVSLVVSH